MTELPRVGRLSPYNASRLGPGETWTKAALLYLGEAVLRRV